jgi:hypothetical protein
VEIKAFDPMSVVLCFVVRERERRGRSFVGCFRTGVTIIVAKDSFRKHLYLLHGMLPLISREVMRLGGWWFPPPLEPSIRKEAVWWWGEALVLLLLISTI